MRGDEEELFRRYHERLLRATGYACRTSENNVEDACAMAWATLARRPDVDRQNVYAWLKTVARHEAMRLDQQAREQIQLDEALGMGYADGQALETGNAYVTPEALGEAMDRLRTLPERQRTVIALRAFGWKYKDIADELGLTFTRVNRLLVEADRKLDELREQDSVATDTRAARLKALEAEPPRHLRQAIGRPPHIKEPRYGTLLRDWRRLALDIEEHRERHGVTDGTRALGASGKNHAEQASRNVLRGRIERFAVERTGPERSIG